MFKFYEKKATNNNILSLKFRRNLTITILKLRGTAPMPNKIAQVESLVRYNSWKTWWKA